MFKKIVIGFVLVLVLLFFIFDYETLVDPAGVLGALDGASIIGGCGVFWGTIILYILICDVFLFWIGAPAGWRWARNLGMGLNAPAFFVCVVCAYIGIYLSFPIAVVQLFRSDT